MSKKAIRETVGVLGVVASLLFVGLEIRQSTAVARGQTRQELEAMNQAWLTLITADPYYSDLWYRAWVTDGEIAPDEEYRAAMMMTQFMRRLENIYFQHAEGLVDETALRSYGLQDIGTFFAMDRFQQWWVEKRWRQSFHPSFVAFVEEQVRR
jgi:hypothetical protein